MDFGNAALLVAAVLGLVSLVRSFVFGDRQKRLVASIVVGSSAGATFLVGATTWANQQVIGDVAMKAMSVPDKLLVVVFVAGAASAAWETLGAVKNIGAPEPSKAQRKALDEGALASIERWAYLAHDEAAPPRG